MVHSVKCAFKCLHALCWLLAGISGKSQVLFALVFTTRYLDLLTSFISLYNTTMKIIYIGCAYATVYLIYMKFKATYDGNHDTFRVEFLVVPVGGLAFLVNHDFSPLEILWTFSIYLESVAILPQLFMISKTGEAETITTHYLFFLGLYRALYLINWIWRFYFEGFFDMIAIVAGVVQTILYCDFFYLYVTKGEHCCFFISFFYSSYNYVFFFNLSLWAYRQQPMQ
uniref:ER lumen protein-retaining receptor n=1 Tax=Amphiprion percula TaxID=161767 RepID=A0A3P8TL13_AMPPE